MNEERKFVRLFVAVSLPEELKETLIKVQRELREVLSRSSTAWAKANTMHLTLRFLGNVEASRLDELRERLVAGVSGFGGVELVCEQLGCFPDLRRPRVVWAAVRGVDGRLDLLHRRVDEMIGGFAEKPAESPYVGHVTLGRPKQIKRADVERLAKFVEGAAGRQFGSWRCGEVKLMSSQLSSDGSRYEVVAVAPLGG